ncbi:MAG: TonB-dependent receptor, partial [candidate division KSB1 bacterium]|nr:TonB-dependent receptor [candidate division KSB1 bacterium]
FSGNFFKNQYQNKFRIFSTPGLPIAFYDNTPNARISGFETKASLFLFRKKVTADLGLSKYSISEKAAFPFKADFKATFNLLFDHAGYSFQLHLFKEGEQAGWVRFSETSNDSTGLAFCQYAEVRLPSFSNLDLHFSKSFSLGKFKFLANASGRNLLNAQEVVLQGLALRDRRYYLTFGAQY